jgi:hypothetical protein
MRSAGNFNPEWGYLAPAPSFMRTARVVLVATAIGATAGAAVVLSLIDRPAAEGDKTASIAAHAIVTSVQAATATTTPPASTASAVLTAPVKVTAAVPTSVAPVARPQIVPEVVQQIATQPPPAAATPRQSVAIVPEVVQQIATQPPPAAATPRQSVAIVPPPVAATRSTVVEPRQQPTFNAPVADANVAPAPKPAAGMAALSETAPASAAAPADASDQALIPPETVPPEKKTTKHQVAGSYASNAKDRPAPGLGTVLRRLFSPQSGNSYYPNR